MVDWQAVGAIGEIGGAFVVFITLMYLSLQVRYAKQSMRRQHHTSVNNAFNQSFHAVATSPGLAGIVRKAEAGEALTPDEHVQIRNLVLLQFNGFEEAYLHAEETKGMLEISEITEMLRIQLQTEAYRQVWEEMKWQLHPRYVAAVESALGSDTSH